MKKIKKQKPRKPRPIVLYLNGRYQSLDPTGVPSKEIRKVAERLMRYADWADLKERK